MVLWIRLLLCFSSLVLFFRDDQYFSRGRGMGCLFFTFFTFIVILRSERMSIEL